MKKLMSLVAIVMVAVISFSSTSYAKGSSTTEPEHVNYYTMVGEYEYIPDYNDLLRYPEEYIGMNVYMIVDIAFVHYQENYYNAIGIDFEYDYYYDAYDYVYVYDEFYFLNIPANGVMVIDDLPSYMTQDVIPADRLIEDDVVTIYGEFTGLSKSDKGNAVPTIEIHMAALNMFG